MAQAELKLRNVEFSKAVRGYSCEEVDTYLAYVNDRYSALVQECVELRRKMTVQAAGQNEYREEALKEKEKIAAETGALVEAARKEAARVLDTAKQKAARLLADAETAAAGILKQAEEKAAQIPAAKPVPETAAEDADFVAAQNNIADRMVAEIESFRQSVFNMYAKHIEELEELARLTDRFYETKEALSAGYQTEDEPQGYPTDLPEALPEDTENETFMPLEALAAEEPANDDDILASLYTDDDEDDALLRIDWKKHRAEREPELPEDGEEDPFAIFAAEDEEEEDDLIARAYAEQPDTDVPTEEEDGEEEFLSDIANAYLNRPKNAAPAKQSAPVRNPDTLDDLFEAEEGRSNGLTSEFDFIYNSKKSADNVAQIRRQPLMDAQKPAKPKKHGNK